MAKKKTLSALITLLVLCTLLPFYTQAITARFKVFKDHIHNTTIALIYNTSQETILDQVHSQEIDKLLDFLAQNKKNTHFLYEPTQCLHMHRTINDSMKEGSVTYFASSPHTEHDLFILDIFRQIKECIKLPTKKNAFSQAFYDMTIPWYLERLKKRSRELHHEISVLRAPESVKKYAEAHCYTLYHTACETIEQIKKNFQLPDNAHILDVIISLHIAQQYDVVVSLVSTLLEEQANISNIITFKQILKSSPSADYVIVHIDTSHAHQLATLLEVQGMDCINGETTKVSIRKLSNIDTDNVSVHFAEDLIKVLEAD